jgi:tRNA A37 threonylcarbamoyladenosine modification protein TsaB
MTLLLDTTERLTLRLALFRGRQLIKQVQRPLPAQELQCQIEQLLQGQKLPLTELKGIVVRQPASSLTGWRIGLTTANTLGWLLKRPVRAVEAKTWAAALEQLALSA